MRTRNFLLTSLLVVPMIAMALDDIATPKGGAFYDGTTLMPRLDAETTDTTATLYTPRYVGDMLIGVVSTSNALWVSRGLTTNDWILVTDSGGPFSDADISTTAAIAHTKLAAVLPGRLLVGSASSQAVAVAVSGDITIATTGTVTIANDAINAAKMGTIHQADAQATTTNTLYTPAFIGQLLTGQTGAGTVTLWIAKGATTNDWVQVVP
jgi:hypothetical protein